MFVALNEGVCKSNSIIVIKPNHFETKKKFLDCRCESRKKSRGSRDKYSELMQLEENNKMKYKQLNKTKESGANLSDIHTEIAVR